MNNNGVIFICFLCLFLLLCGVVCASDANCTSDDLSSPSVDDVKIDEDVLSAENTTNNLASENTNDQILKDSSTGTFTELSNIISSSSTGIIKLTKDYAYDSSTDSAFKNGISITRDSISINGLGHSISGSGASNIFSINSNGVILKNIILKDAVRTNDYAIAVRCPGSNAQFIKCTFENNYAGGNAAALWTTGPNTQVTNCIFKNNRGTGQNAAMRIGQAATGTKVIDCVFYNNTAGSYSGALYVYAPECLVSGCTFEKNSADNHAGGVYVAGAHATITHCDFIENDGMNGDGGALRFGGAANYALVEYCNFINNKAQSYGALQSEGGGAGIIVSHCTFIGNRASKNGGAMNYATSGTSWNNLTFINNTAGQYGGALYCDYTYIIAITDSYFYNNHANRSGGAAYSNSQHMELNNCIFINNTAGNYGGAVRTGSPVFNCYFECNSANYGGAIELGSSNQCKIVSNCTFVNNTGIISGGAIQVDATNSFIEDSKFTGNNAPMGGAIYNTIDTVSVEDSIFENNNASLGGAIYNSGQYFTEHGCTFTDNTAENCTGAMYLLENSEVSINYTDPLYVNSTNIINMPFELTVTNNGTGEGSESDVTLDYALSHIANNGNIYLSPGIYYTEKQISTNPSVYFNLIGKGNVIIDFSNFNPNNSPIYTNGYVEIRNLYFRNVGNYPGKDLISSTQSKYASIVNCTFDKTYSYRPFGRYINTIDCTFKNYDERSPVTYTFRADYFINCTFRDNSKIVANIGNDAWEWINCTFINNTAGVFSITGNNHVVSGCKFYNNSATRGAAIYSTDNNFYLSDCIFEGNTVTGDGGAVYITGYSPQLINNTFSYNKGTNGGALYSKGTDLVLINSNFYNNTATNDGGAVYNAGSNLVVNNSEFIDNHADNRGGALYSTGVNPNIYKSIFINNTAGYGGGFYSGGDNAKISESSFIDNNASNGSAIMLGVDTTMHIASTNFANNVGLNNTVYLADGSLLTVDISSTNLPKIDTRGPGTYNPTMRLIYVDNYNTFVRSGTLDDPTSLVDALTRVSDEGEIRILNGTYVILTPITIEDKSFNITGWNSSNVFISNPMFTVNSHNVRFINLHFIDLDEDITWLGNGGVIKSCSFNGAATNMPTSYISVDGESFSIIDSNFTSFKYHNILYASLDSILIKNCIFEYNVAYNSSKDYILDLEGAESSIINSKFTDNNIKLINFGSALTYSNIVDGCLFRNNSVSFSDGSLILVNCFNSQIINSNFTNNVARSVVNVNGTGFSFSKCLFKDNLGLYGGAIYLTKDVVVINSTFMNNSAVNGSAIYYSGDSRLGIVDCNFAYPKFDENNNVVEGYIYSNIDVNLTRITFSFTDLNHVVSKAEDVLNLTYNYKYFDDYDVPFQSGVTINETLNINGNSHILDGSDLARVFKISADNVRIINMTFVDAHITSDNGGAILWSGSNGSISDSFFINCSAVNAGSYLNYGGAVCVSGANMNITDCTFDSCVSNLGSALRINKGNSVITNCNFTNNNADQYDGAIWYDGTNSGNFVLSDCIFRGNNASCWGGALRVDSKGSINNCIFENNAVVYSYKTSSGAGNGYGGAIYLTGNGVSITNSTFKGNYVDNLTSMCGGGIYASKAFTLSNCYFMNNSASNGSAIYYVSNSDLNIDSCTFANPRYDQTNNRLAGYIYSTHVINFNNITLSFTDLNHTIANSGDSLDLIFNYMFFNEFDQKFVSGVPISKDITINGNCFILDGNHSARIFNVTSGNVELSNLTFRNGNATLGGAIYVIGNITVLNSNFTNNSAVLGGAIFIESGYSNLTNCTFNNNTAANGSAIYIITSVNHWDNLDFINNIASTNATIYFREDSTVYSDNLTFTDNVIPNGLQIVGENHIYAPIIYVNATKQGFGIIMSEPTSLTIAVDNILDNGIIIICSDYTLETIIKLNNLTNVTVTGNHALRKGKYLFIIPIIQKYIKKKQIVF